MITGDPTPYQKQGPQWRYYHCDCCERYVTVVLMDRGDVKLTMQCGNVMNPGAEPKKLHGRIVASSDCTGTMRLGGEGKRAAWPQAAQKDADFVFYRPTKIGELRRMKHDAPSLHDWVRAGGLVMRATNHMTPKWSTET